MTQDIDSEDAELDRQWRARFGQPLPMIGSPAIVRRILREAEHDADPERAYATDPDALTRAQKPPAR